MILLDEMVKRRKALLSLLPKASAFVLPGYRMQYSSQNIFYRFKQNNNVIYFTGLKEPGDAVVISYDHKWHLFRQPDTPESVLWEGAKTPDDVIKQNHLIDHVHDLQTLSGFIDDLPNDVKLYLNQSQNDCVRFEADDRTLSVDPFIHRLRVIKSEYEIEQMEQSCQIAGNVFNTLRKKLRGMETERHVENYLEAAVKTQGAEGLAYVPVVAGGPRACTIHYTRNDQKLMGNELLLVDAGCVYNDYCSDITRTLQVGKLMTAAQEKVLEAVKTIQQTVLDWLAQNWKHHTLMDLQSVAYHQTVRELQSTLGVDPKHVDTLFPHAIGHYLGMDLHDCPTVGMSTKLKPGMIITIEPGLYFTDSLDYPEEYRGIGVRVEDDVLITESGPRVLTENAEV